jgi:pimeloyl-ACP methyl ester carboxylesterase
MPILQHKNAKIFYEDSGTGEPIITVHGMSFNNTYWSRSGLSTKLSEHYRVISMDMRGHGQTQVEGEPLGFEVDTIGDDIEALANALGFQRFHLLGHSSGGMVAVRYAMRASKRLISLMLTSTSSATMLMPTGDESARRQRVNKFAEIFEKQTLDQILAYFRKNPYPFFDTLMQHPNRELMWQTVEEILRLNDPKLLAIFVRSFFTDPDLQLKKLAHISCPTLILTGEHDSLFIEPSRLMARTIPVVKYVVLEGVGHIIAIEAPARTCYEIVNFIKNLP